MIVGVIVAEMLGASLGFLITRQRTLLDSPGVYTGIVLVLAMTGLHEVVLRRLERRRGLPRLLTGRDGSRACSRLRPPLTVTPSLEALSLATIDVTTLAAAQTRTAPFASQGWPSPSPWTDRVARGGRESIDHPRGGRDDMANAAAGALVAAARPPSLIFLTGPAPSAPTDADCPTCGGRHPYSRCSNAAPSVAELRRAGLIAGSSPWGW